MAARKKSQSASPSRTIVFQGQLGAYSHLACRKYFPKMTPLPTPSFEDTLEAVREGHAKLAMIPIENSVAGRVPDIHQIMPDSGLYIIGERFLLGAKVDNYAEVQLVRTMFSTFLMLVTLSSRNPSATLSAACSASYFI